MTLSNPNSQLVILGAVVTPGAENRLSRYTDTQMTMAKVWGKSTSIE